MKILHTSDLHLGISLCSERLLEYQQALAGILCNAVSENKIDCVIIAGDIFDSAMSSGEAIAVWDRIVTVLCKEAKVPVLVCAGNHDGAARLSSCAELLASSGLYISGKLTPEITPVSIGCCDFYLIPYFNPSEARILYDCSENNPMTSILDSIRENMDRTRTNIAVAHCFVNGAEVSESDNSARAAASVGGSDIVPVSAFSDFDYVALGHLHKPQTIKNSNSSVRYSGTPLRYSFSEVSHTKTFSVFDTDTKEVSEIPVPDLIRLRIIEDTYENIIENSKNDTNRNDFMKIVMTDRFKGESTYSQITELYPNTLIFQGASYHEDTDETYSAKEICELDVISLAKKYIEHMRGTEPDNDEVEWLAQAFKECEREDEQ